MVYNKGPIKIKMKSKTIILNAILIGLVALLMGCGPSTPQEHENKALRLLPSGAKIVENLGNKWVVFEIKGKKFIYRGRAIGAYGGTEVLAPWVDGKVEQE